MSPAEPNELGEMPGDHQQGAAGDDQIRMTPVEEGQHPGGQGDVDDVAPAPAQRFAAVSHGLLENWKKDQTL